MKRGDCRSKVKPGQPSVQTTMIPIPHRTGVGKMSKALRDNVCRMNNPELIGLAKNRWLPPSVQMAIAKHPYTRAHWYLAENPGLHQSTRDYMWSDDCNRGYSIKAMLLTHGHYANDPDKYREFYEKYGSAWSRSSWRMSAALFGMGRSYYPNTTASSATPSDLLNRVYDERYSSHAKGTKADSYSPYRNQYEIEWMAKHQNVDIELAIKLSQHESAGDRISKLGFAKIVELSR